MLRHVIGILCIKVTEEILFRGFLLKENFRTVTAVMQLVIPAPYSLSLFKKEKQKSTFPLESKSSSS